MAIAQDCSGGAGGATPQAFAQQLRAAEGHPRQQALLLQLLKESLAAGAHKQQQPAQAQQPHSSSLQHPVRAGPASG